MATTFIVKLKTFSFPIAVLYNYVASFVTTFNWDRYHHGGISS